MAPAPDTLTLEELDRRLRTILPAEYQDSYEDMQPVPMRSAGLKFAADGRVAWNEIWGSFCDLAMAGGPPHKGALLEPGSRQAIEAAPARYEEVVAEICRGISMTTGLPAVPSASAGWVRVSCHEATAAEWLLRAIVMENVTARASGDEIELPAAPTFRLEKEIKNVITVIAKTYHYWDGHMPFRQQWAIRRLFDALSLDCPLVEPAHPEHGASSPAQATLTAALARDIQRDLGLTPAGGAYAGWLGVQCPSVGDAIWMMRALVVCNVLARREDRVLLVPVNAVGDPAGLRMRRGLGRVYRLWQLRR